MRGTQADEVLLPSVAAARGWVSCVGLGAVPGAMGAKEVLSRRHLPAGWDGAEGLGALG